MSFLDKFRKKDSKIQAILLSGSGSVLWSEYDYENFAKETYLKNVIAFRCIDIIAKSVASVPWSLYRKKEEGRELVTAHSVNSILTRPNPDESFNYLMLKATAFLVMAGNSYFERVAPKTGPNTSFPRELYVHRPDRMTILVDKTTGKATGFKYIVNGRSVIWEYDNGKCDILQVKNFHPTNDWYGASITESAAREIDTSNEATNWNKSLLQNQGRPGMLFISKDGLTDAQFERLEKMMDHKFSGSEKAGKNMILEGMNDVKPYGWNPAEMDFIEGNRELARRISYAYGVPPMLIGIPGDNTYSNYQEARLAFWEETIFYYLNLFKGELNNWIFGDDLLFIDYDIDDIPALSLKRDKLWDRAQNSDFLSINEKRELVGLESWGPEGDVILTPSTQIPLGMEADFNEDDNAELEDEESED